MITILNHLDLISSAVVNLIICCCCSRVCDFSGYTETLDDSIELVVPEDDYGLYAIDILDPSAVRLIVLLLQFFSVHEYLLYIASFFWGDFVAEFVFIRK